MRRPRFWYTILGLSIAVAGCGGDQASPLEPMSQSLLGTSTKPLSAILLQCSPLPASTHSASIGSRGGSLRIGPHTLVVPKGALSRNVTITGEVVSGNVNSVRMQPEGLRFQKSATLTMSYSNCTGILSPKKIVYTDELLNLLQILSSTDLPRSKSVKANLEHFSRYAIAY
jgi:hypothetical protein